MEILAPAGNFDMLRAAVCCGANAVYLGGNRFNARQNADNFGSNSLKNAVEYCHTYGVRVCFTLNTLLFDDELPEMRNLLLEADAAGVDALLVCDMSVIRAAQKMVPHIPLHASTQMTVHNAEGVQILQKIGISRVVLARELSAPEIKEIRRSTDMELEVFVHGALCMSVSGQCLMSSVVGGRSGNRGLCAAPCRLPMKNGAYPLSLKDLSLIKHIRELETLGITAVKIEGRLKRPEYVAAAVTAVREAIEGGQPDMETLSGVFSRSGFTDGYFRATRNRSMFGVKKQDRATPELLLKLWNLYAAEPTPKTIERSINNKTCDIFQDIPFAQPEKQARVTPELRVRLEKISQLSSKFGGADIILPPHEYHGGRFVEIPRIVFPERIPDLRHALEEAVRRGAKEALVGNIFGLTLAEEYGLTPHADWTLNITNGESGRAYQSIGCRSVTLSPEVNAKRQRRIPLDFGIVGYGFQPVMALRNCPGKCGECRLIDRRGKTLNLICSYGVASLLNCSPLYIGDLTDKFPRASFFTLYFTNEKPERVMKVVKMFQNHESFDGERTKGLYFRDVF